MRPLIRWGMYALAGLGCLVLAVVALLLAGVGVIALSIALAVFRATHPPAGPTPFDRWGLPTGAVSKAQLLARLEATLVYPGARIVRRSVTGEYEDVWNGGAQFATADTVLLAPASPGQVYAWYTRQLSARGWHPDSDVDGSLPDFSPLIGDSRSPREHFQLSYWIKDVDYRYGPPPPGLTRVEVTYAIVPYSRQTAARGRVCLPAAYDGRTGTCTDDQHHIPSAFSGLARLTLDDFKTAGAHTVLVRASGITTRYDGPPHTYTMGAGQAALDLPLTAVLPVRDGLVIPGAYSLEITADGAAVGEPAVVVVEDSGLPVGVPEAHLFYPGATVNDTTSGVIPSTGARPVSAPTYTVWILTTDDAPAAVYRWYDTKLRQRGWHRVATASRPGWIDHRSYARGPHATFTVALLDGRSMRRFWGDRLGRGRTVVEVRYRQ